MTSPSEREIDDGRGWQPATVNEIDSPLVHKWHDVVSSRVYRLLQRAGASGVAHYAVESKGSGEADEQYVFECASQDVLAEFADLASRLAGLEARVSNG